MNRTLPLFAVTLAVVVAAVWRCSSGQFIVPDHDLYTDRYKLAAKYMQIVETQNDKNNDTPAAERYARNCAAAESTARGRFKSLYPAVQSEGKRVGERFEKNAGCTVRMVFKTE